jgi:hypothetical protein
LSRPVTDGPVFCQVQMSWMDIQFVVLCNRRTQAEVCCS